MPKQQRPPADAESDADLQAELDAVADQLYGLPLDQFSDARDDYVRQAREQKNAPLAREIGKLRKPTQSAWLINLLWRDQREVMQQLFQLAGELSDAQAAAAGSALRELTQQRRQIESALLRRASALAAEQGVRVSDAVEREAQETLSAALALPEVADEVRTGRLVKAASYAGFGAAPGSAQVRHATPARPPIDLQAVQRARSAARKPPETDTAESPRDSKRSARSGKGAEDDGREDRESREREQRDAEERQRRQAEEEAEQQRRQEEERRRREAQRRVDAARQALSAADAEVASATRAAGAAAQRSDDLRQRVGALREQLERLQAEADRAAQAASEAEDARQRAEAERQTAQDALRRAERDADR